MEAERCAAFAQDRRDAFADPIRGSNGDRGLVDDDLRRVHVPPDGGGNVEHMAEVRRTVRLRRRINGDEKQVAMADSNRRVGREAQPPRPSAVGEEFDKSRLVNRHDAALETVDPIRVDVHANDTVAHLREARAGDKPDVAGAEHGEIHGSPQGAGALAAKVPKLQTVEDSRFADRFATLRDGVSRAWRATGCARSAVHPYARFEASDRLSAWGVLCYGTGDLTLAMEDSEGLGDTDTSMRAARAHYPRCCSRASCAVPLRCASSRSP